MFCSKCGTKLADDVAFCKKCGAKVSVVTQPSDNCVTQQAQPVKWGSLHEEKNMDTRAELVAKIEYSEKALKTMNNLEANIKKLERKMQEVEKEQSEIRSKGTDSVGDVIIACIKGLVIGFFIGLLIGGTVFAKIAFWGDFVLVACAALGLFIPIMKQIIAANYEKNVMPGKLAEKDIIIEKIRVKIKEAEQKAGEYIFSDEWKKAEQYIPRDYFYLTAMEKMKYFLINGHADSIKEAVRLYDEYLHREKLEYEAKRAADMSEMTAAAANEAAEYAKIIKEQNESIEFWTKMNAYTSSNTKTEVKTDINIYIE